MPSKKKKLILQEINTIMKKVPLLHWKENLARISMEDQRVDTDLIYIDSYEIPKIVPMVAIGGSRNGFGGGGGFSGGSFGGGMSGGGGASGGW